MADVYLARTQGPGGFQKLLVVKLARFTGDPMFSTMFLDEARLAAQLSHPNIVQTYEVGEEGSRHYIVMEYLDGANFARLRQLARKAGQDLSLRFSLHVITQVLEGLNYAHQARGIDGKMLMVVHRDLTPSNIILSAHGAVKIVDFGIAKGADSHSFTQTGRYSGKVSYMPPEQLRGEHVDHRADIFSVGVILAESLHGERFWGNSTPAMVASRLGRGELPTLRRDLDPELMRICERALAPDCDDRYPNAAIFKADVMRYLQRVGPLEADEFAEVVKQLTADDREKLQAVIEQQLQVRSSQVTFSYTPAPDLPQIEHTPSSEANANANANNQSNQPIATRPSTSLPVVTTPPPIAVPSLTSPVIPTQPPPPPTSPAPPILPTAPTHRLPKAVVFVCLGALAAIALLVIAKLVREPSAPAPTPTATAPTAPVNARLEVVASPADAKVTLDGRSVGTNPFIGTYPRDSQIHTLVVTAAGYETVERRFTLDQDTMLQLRLEPVKVATAAPAPAPPAPAPAAAPISPPATAAPPAPAVASAPPPHVAQPVVRAPVRSVVTRKAPTPAPAPAPPPAPTVQPPPPPVATTPATPEPTKRKLDSDPFDKQTKRAIDTSFDTPKSSIDRNNPWKK